MHPTFINPMLQQDCQYPPMHHVQYTGMPPYGWAVPAYIHSNEYHAENHTGAVQNEVIRGDNLTEKEICGPSNHPNNKVIDMESTPNRAGNYQGAVIEGGNRPQAHEQNPDAVTPHRGNMGRNDENISRRVSFSPMVPLVNTPATVVKGKM